MPTYVLKTSNSDLTGGADWNKVISTGTEAANSITFTIAGTSTEDQFAFTAAGVPNSTAWETGDWTVEVNVLTGFLSIQISVAIARVNSAGVQQEISAFTAEQQGTAGVKTFSLTGLSWANGNAGDRIKVVYRFRTTAGAKTVEIETGTVDCQVTSPVVEDTAAGAESVVLMSGAGWGWTEGA